MITNLIARVKRLEQKHRPNELRAVISGLIKPLGPDDPRLQEGPNDEGEAVISPWWSVWFFEGTRDQQEERLKQLREDEELQNKWDEGEIPIRYEGGGCWDDVCTRLHEEELREKQKRNLDHQS